MQNTRNIPLEPAEKSKVRRNINISERKSIKSLANAENIIIKQANKGGTTVIMTKEFYQKQIENMLLNSEYNKTNLDNNPHKEKMKKYRSLLKEHQTELTKTEFDFLTNFECKTSNF